MYDSKRSVVVSTLTVSVCDLIILKCVSHVQEEEKLIQCELASIKEQVSSPNTSMV